VVAGNLAKFGSNPELGAFLATTRPSVLVEASPRDRIWGIGNLLGFALMNVRDQL